MNANDLLFLLVNSYTGGGTNDTTFSDPSGWTRITATAYVNQFFSNNGMVGLWWKRAAGTEGGTTVSVVRGGTTTEVFQGQVYRVSGAETVGNPWDDVQVNNTAGGTVTVGWLSTTVLAPERTMLALVVNTANANLTSMTATYTSVGRDGTALGSTSSVEAFWDPDVTSAQSADAQGGAPNGWATVHLSIKPYVIPWPDPTYHDTATLRVGMSALRNR